MACYVLVIDGLLRTLKNSQLNLFWRQCEFNYYIWSWIASSLKLVSVVFKFWKSGIVGGIVLHVVGKLPLMLRFW